MGTEDILLRILEIQNSMMVHIYALADCYGINWKKFSEDSQKIDEMIAEVRKASERR